MWDLYKKTFVGMQTIILLVTLLIFMRSHLWTHAVIILCDHANGLRVGCNVGH